MESDQRPGSPSSDVFADLLTSALTSPAAVPLPTRVTYRALRDAIADALYVVSAHDLADECVRLGLSAQSPDEPDPMQGKRRYVTRRLTDHSVDQLLALARTVNDEYETDELAHLLTLAGARGVAGELKNLIFAANGPKPKIVLRDAVNNTIEVTENGEFCLIYDRALPEAGLTWRALTAWWADDEQHDTDGELAAARDLYRRLLASMDGNEAEQLVFNTYGGLYASRGFDTPALIPQVYLHYDPYNRDAGGTLVRQRMDFLLLLPGRRRVVIEVDGVHHYADSHRQASPKLYAEMASEDRKLRLAGYEVYRIGGQELVDRSHATPMLTELFQALLGPTS